MLAKKLEIKKAEENLSSKFNIVLIDQNEMLLNLLEHELSKNDLFSVKRTTNGIEYLNGDSIIPDLIIMDMIMEGINGIEMIKKIRKIPRFDKTKIIVLSEKLNNSDSGQLKNLRIDDIIQKPANIGEVLFRIEKVIDQ